MTKSLRKKIFSFIGISIGGIIIGIFISAIIMLRFSIPPTDGNLTADGVHSEVEITFDEMGIPQIWAENETDAYYALGFQHAADRLFQMDLSRRFASGRLSEMIGETTIEVDKQQRLIGHSRMGQAALEKLSPENLTRLKAYISGINFYIESCPSLPFEYRLLPVECELWTITDCLTLLSFQSWFSNSLMNRDEFYNDLVKKVGLEKARTLVIPYPNWAPTTVGNKAFSVLNDYDLEFKKLSNASLIKKTGSNLFQISIAESLLENGFPFLLTEASNAWVIAPEKSESGHAILASDPHLELSRLPQFWYAIGVHVKDSLNVLGITAPGIPFVVMGHNGVASWAFTAGGTDVTDYHTLETNPEKENEYFTDDGYEKYEIINDTIYTVTDNIIYSHKHSIYGAIIDEQPDLNKSTALYWVGFDIDLNKTVTSGFDLAKIATFDQFQKTVKNFGALDANMMYADADGNIGYQLAAPLIVRDDDGKFPQPPNTFSSKTFYPLEETPQLLNPPKGWISSCNNKPENSNNVRGHYFVDRILSINHHLSSKDKFSIQDMYDYQMDLTDRYLLRFKDQFAEVLNAIGEVEKSNEMKQWDGSCDSSSYETALISIYLKKLKQFTFEDELGDLYFSLPARWIEQTQTSSVLFNSWYDDINTTDRVETYIDITSKAMKDAITLAGNKSWGELLTIQMKHPLSIVPIVGDLLGLSSKKESHSGTTGSLNASFARMATDGTFETLAGPSMRFVVDFADIDKTTLVLPAGNSGNPMSDHFLDFYSIWKKGERWTVPFSYDKVKVRAVSTLNLIPKEK